MLEEKKKHVSDNLLDRGRRRICGSHCPYWQGIYVIFLLEVLEPTLDIMTQIHYIFRQQHLPED